MITSSDASSAYFSSSLKWRICSVLFPYHFIRLLALNMALSPLVLIFAGCGISQNKGSDSNISDTVSYKVSTSVSGTGTGTVSPSSAIVLDGKLTSFTISPTIGSTLISVTGCGGTLSGNVYTTGKISGICTVSAEFGLESYQVTAVAGEGGSIAPNSITLEHGDIASFEINPKPGYVVESISGCGGTLDGNSYTINSALSDCEIIVAFKMDLWSSVRKIDLTPKYNDPGLCGPDTFVQAATLGDYTADGLLDVAFSFWCFNESFGEPVYGPARNGIALYAQERDRGFSDVTADLLGMNLPQL